MVTRDGKCFVICKENGKHKQRQGFHTLANMQCINLFNNSNF